MQSKWIWHDNTGIWLVLRHQPGLLLPEWHPIGQVTLRHAYPSMPPQWTAFLLVPVGKMPFQWIGAVPSNETQSRERAERMVEEAFAKRNWHLGD